MPRIGFIHDPLDVKLLVLYIMSRIAAPIDFATLTDLALCDDGIDYFLYAQAVEELVNSGHLSKDERGLYAITEKGKSNSDIMESSLPSVVRGRCNRALAQLNDTLRRSQQVTAAVTGQEGRYQVELGLSDDLGPLLRLTLTVPSQAQGDQIAQRFQSHPEESFNTILADLLQEPNEEA